MTFLFSYCYPTTVPMEHTVGRQHSNSTCTGECYSTQNAICKWRRIYVTLPPNDDSWSWGCMSHGIANNNSMLLHMETDTICHRKPAFGLKLSTFSHSSMLTARILLSWNLIWIYGFRIIDENGFLTALLSDMHTNYVLVKPFGRWLVSVSFSQRSIELQHNYYYILFWMTMT